MTAADAVDFALAAYREEGVWQVAELTHDHVEDVETLASALRRFPGDHGAVGLVAVDEDFFVVVRVAGQQTRVLLSDITAASEWELAASAVEFLQSVLGYSTVEAAGSWSRVYFPSCPVMRRSAHAARTRTGRVRRASTWS